MMEAHRVISWPTASAVVDVAVEAAAASYKHAYAPSASPR